MHVTKLPDISADKFRIRGIRIKAAEKSSGL
jgi:hypothetical protein